MKVIRRSADRGHAVHGWLESYHSFSFADYFDEDHVEFGPLRVLNEDRVTGGEGFGTHGHRNMEIISYVLEGELTHQDSLGTRSTIRPGDVQRMSAGSGVRHSEFNGSQTNKLHFLQIWIQPNVTDIPPSYEEKRFEAADKQGRLRLIASSTGESGSVLVHQDVRVYGGLFDGAESASLELPPGRRGYVHVVRGAVHANGVELNAGDALKLTDENVVEIAQGAGAEVLVFDLP
ncbi:MAG TPA: pirin family protein [Steroidobacteraceae bacterium]|nr:pirin family protein [Steroidobacteraceae bacterium]